MNPPFEEVEETTVAKILALDKGGSSFAMT